MLFGWDVDHAPLHALVTCTSQFNNCLLRRQAGEHHRENAEFHNVEGRSVLEASDGTSHLPSKLTSSLTRTGLPVATA